MKSSRPSRWHTASLAAIASVATWCACDSGSSIEVGSARDAGGDVADLASLDGSRAPEAGLNVGNGDADSDAVEGAACASPDDPQNCGACGHSCLGGACTGGRCVPLPIGVLATGQRIPAGLAVDAMSVYWVTEGEYDGPPGKPSANFVNSQIAKCAVSGCQNRPTVLASGLEQESGNEQLLLPFALVGGHVYSSALHQIVECPTDGCVGAPTALSSGPMWPRWFALDANNLYVTAASPPDHTNGALLQCPLAGCASAPLTLASGSLFYGVAVDATTVYWADAQQRILSCSLGGCSGSPTVLAAAQSASTAIVSNGSYVLWTNGTTASGSAPVMASPIHGDAAAPMALTTAAGRADGLAIDAQNAYWTQPLDGLVLKCALSGCSSPTTIASGQSSPAAIAVDDAHVYWTNTGVRGTDGEIRIAPK